jgi:N6-adenosine-specific RNA methylase IME4
VIDIFIDEEFRTALPEPRPEEVAELERQIRRDCAPRDALVVWPTERGLVLVDGHHRLAICRRHGLPFRVEERHFESRDAVLAEIVNTQLARRNLTDSWSKYLLGRDYETGKRQGARTDLTSGNSCQKSTAERIAEERRVGERTVRNAADYARAIDRIANVNPAAKMAILSEKVDLTQNDVIELADHSAVIEEAFSRPDITRGLVRQLLQNARRLEKFGALIQPGTPSPGDNWGRFSVILADPPWSYDDERPFTAASNSFSTLGLEEIVKIWKDDLDMENYLTPDAVLFLWATAPKRPTAHKFIEATGFEYKTELIWVKPRTVFGAYSHCAHENLLIATRGSLTPVKKLRSTFEGKPWSRLHSAKPDVAYEIIEQMYPELLKLELFARRCRAGWESWGNELGRYEQPGTDEEGEDAA